jgi:hypothetical protein
VPPVTKAAWHLWCCIPGAHLSKPLSLFLGLFLACGSGLLVHSVGCRQALSVSFSSQHCATGSAHWCYCVRAVVVGGGSCGSRLLLQATSSLLVAQVCHALAAHVSFFCTLSFIAGCCRRCVYADCVGPARPRCVHWGSRVDMSFDVQVLLSWVSVFVCRAISRAACAVWRCRVGRICCLMYRRCCLGSLFLCAELSQGLHVQCGVAEWVVAGLSLLVLLLSYVWCW